METKQDITLVEIDVIVKLRQFQPMECLLVFQSGQFLNGQHVLCVGLPIKSAKRNGKWRAIHEILYLQINYI